MENRRDFMMKTGLAGLASLGVPGLSYGKNASASGQITSTLTGEPIKDARLNFRSFTDDPDGELIATYKTDSKGFYGDEPTPVGFDKWKDIKSLYTDNPNPELLKKALAKRR